jgi:hypothetical protein
MTGEKGEPIATPSGLIAELGTKGNICRSEEMLRYGQSVFTKVSAEEVKL